MKEHEVQTSLLFNPDCPFGPFLEEGDTHCFEPQSTRGYEVVSEDHPDFDIRLAEVRNIGFDVVPIAQQLPKLPSFIPDVGGGNGKVLTDLAPKFVATTLDRIISPRTLKVSMNVHEVVGLPRSATILINGYAEDTFLEKIWDQRYETAVSLSRLNAVFTSPDYSVFLDQPHAERFINIKRSLIFFELLQNFGAKTIPTMHWTGLKDLQRWAAWINANSTIFAVALDLQMADRLWLMIVNQLKAFIELLNRQVHFLVTGLSVPKRISEIRSILKSVTIVSGTPLQTAIKHKRLVLTLSDTIKREPSELPTPMLVKLNTELLQNICRRPTEQISLLWPRLSATRYNL